MPVLGQLAEAGRTVENVEVPLELYGWNEGGGFCQFSTLQTLSPFKRRPLSKLRGYKKKTEMYSLFLKCICFMMISSGQEP